MNKVQVQTHHQSSPLNHQPGQIYQQRFGGEYWMMTDKDLQGHYNFINLKNGQLYTYERHKSPEDLFLMTKRYAKWKPLPSNQQLVLTPE